jgi:hypothetical protein
VVQKENSETVVCFKGYCIVQKYFLNKKNEKIILVPVGLFGKTGKTLAKDLIQCKNVFPRKHAGDVF